MYAQYRPRYNDEVVKSVASRVENKDLYLDVACGILFFIYIKIYVLIFFVFNSGSGQLTSLLSKHFVKTVGVDRSFEQLKYSGSSQNVKFIAGDAFHLPVADNAVDLLTVAQGLHWLVPHEKFFKEVNRVLKPNGVFAAVGYTVCTLLNENLEQNFKHYYDNILGSRKEPGEDGCFWDISRPSLDSLYSDVEFPYTETLQRNRYFHRVAMPVDDFFEYLRTMSAYRSLLNKGVADPLPELMSSFLKTLDTSDKKSKIEVEFTFFSVSFLKSSA